MNIDKAVRLSHHLVTIVEVKTRPNRILPASVEGFDVGLKSAAQRRYEHRGDFQRQAHPSDSSQAVGPPMSSVKDRAVIELGVAGKPHLTPMFEQAFDREFRDDLCVRPSRTQSAVQADSGQHIHVDPTANDQVVNGVKVVHLSTRLVVSSTSNLSATLSRAD